jgi:putative peptidoglycan lipid II flippase
MPSAATSPTSTSVSTAKATRPLQAALLLSALYFLARFTGLFQSALISALMPSYATDAYTVAFTLPDALNYLVAGGALSSTFIPIFTGFWGRGKEAQAWRFYSTLASVMGLGLIVLTALMMLFTPFLLGLAKPGLLSGEKGKHETFVLAVEMTRIILPAQLCFYIGGLQIGVLNTFKRFGASGWTGAVYNVVATIFALIVWARTQDPRAFAWGILIGAFAGNFLLPFLALRYGPAPQRPRFRFILDLQNPALKRFFMLALPIMLGISLPVVDQWVIEYFASSLPVGSLTYLRNGNRLMIAAQGILGQAAAVAVFPYLASEGAAGSYRTLADFLRTGLRRLLFVTLPISVLLILGAEPICSLVYGWKEFSDPHKIQATAVAFAFFNIGLFAWGAQGLVARAFYALGDTKTPTIVGSALTVLFFVPLCYFMGDTANDIAGTRGLALATSIGAAVYFVVQLLALEHKLKSRPYQVNLDLGKISGTFLRTMAASALSGIAGLLALLLAKPIAAHDKIGDIGLLLWTWGIAGWVFMAAANQFQIPEWFWLRDKVLRRRKRAAN